MNAYRNLRQYYEYANHMLLRGAFDRKLDVVKTAFEAGADVNGDESIPPIAAATLSDHAGIVEFLLEKGADPDKPVTAELPCPGVLGTSTMLGERALHLAARSRNVELVRVLLERSGADINATDNKGRTPLMITCETSVACVEVVRLLLDAGADAALAQEDGYTPMHAVAENGHMHLVDMVCSKAPGTLSHFAAAGQTPLLWACVRGHESMVSKLLSLGATQRRPPHEGDRCPLKTAVLEGSVGVVRILTTEEGIRALGDKMLIVPGATYLAVRFQARALRLLLRVDGEERRSWWANHAHSSGSSLLHVGAGYCCPAGVSVLLEAGADEALRDAEGRTPRDAIGIYRGVDGLPEMDRGEEVAVRRMLQRGPAYRARSWAWPSDEETRAGGGGSAAAAASDDDDDDAALSSPPVVKTAHNIGVRIFRPKEKTSSSKLFARVVGRYCAKG